MKRLAIITTHPIQYNAPLFQLLAQRSNIAVHVFYTWGTKVLGEKYDPGFSKVIDWDIPLLEGYSHSFVENRSAQAGSHHFAGIDNPTLIQEVEDWGANAVLVFGWNFKSHLRLLRYFHNKIPVLFRGDSTLLDEANGIRSIIKRFLLKWVYRHVDIAFYVGAANKAYYRQSGLAPARLKYAAHAIDNLRFSEHGIAYRHNACTWRKQLGIGDDDIVFLYAGKLEPKKDPLLLIRAFQSLKTPGVHLIMVGNGILEHQVKKACMAETNIHFQPFQNQSSMPVVYNLADIFVLPSRGPGETWGLSVNEAMACSKPVLVSDKCGCAYDLVQEGLNGYIFKAGSETDLVNKMRSLLISKEELNKMGKASFILVDKWSLEKIASAIEEVVATSK